VQFHRAEEDAEEKAGSSQASEGSTGYSKEVLLRGMRSALQG